MPHSFSSQPDPSKPSIYQIRLKGHLAPRWADWFAGMEIALTTEGDTLLTGPMTDQAALHGVLKKIRDAGLPLISLNPAQE